MYNDPELNRRIAEMQQAERLADFIMFLIVAAIVGFIIYRIYKSSANKRKIQQDILNELKKQNRAVN